MTFTTFTFVLFLAVVFGLYWSVGSRRWQNAILVASSYAFYGWWDARFCGLLLASSLVDFFVGLSLDRTEQGGRRKSLLVASLVFNLGLLAVFKYFNFFVENFVVLAASLGWRVDPLVVQIILPVGISFYTFQTLSYTIDVYRRNLPATRSLLDYLAYVSFFPQLVAGPIERGLRLLPQLTASRRFDRDKAVDGCRQILWGFFKKMVLADNLAAIVDGCYGVETCSGPHLMFATVCFAFQIYWDFSAYSDIAIGTARLFGVDLMRNFAYPYFSQSVAEFWRRWHISLSTWFRDYVYIPLGGSRSRPMRRALNVMATFVISGLWHGASWNFVIWGAVNGLAILPTLRGKRERISSRDVPGGEALIPKAVVVARMVGTFAAICAAWVFFRARTLGEALSIFRRMATDVFDVAAWIELQYDLAILVLISSIVAVEWFQRRHPHPLVLDNWPRAVRWIIYTCLIWGSLALVPQKTTQFIYFQF